MNKILVISVITVSHFVNALWFPHLTPKAYEKEDLLDIFAGQLRSDLYLNTYNFYYLSWCDSTDDDFHKPNSEVINGVTMRDTELVKTPY